MASSCLSLSLSFASGTRPRLATRSRLAACSSADWESLTSAARLLPYAASACAAPDTVSTRLTSKPRSSEVWSPRLGSRLLPASSSRCFVISTVPSRIAFSCDDVTSPSVAAESLNWLTAAFCRAESAHPVRSTSATAREKMRGRAVLGQVMSSLLVAAEMVRELETDGPSAPVAVAAGLGVLVELACQVQSLEDELERRCRARWIARAELLHGGVERTHLGDLADVFLGRHRVGDVDAEAALEGGHDRIQLAAREATVEDVEHRLLHELAEHLVLAAVAEGLQLDLAAGRGHDGAEVAHPRGDLALVQPDGALERVGEKVLPVTDADPHRHARALADLGRLARQVRQLGHDLLHVRRRHVLEAGRRELRELGLHDGDLVLEPPRIVRADLRAEAVLEGRDDAPTVRVVLGVGAGDDIHIDRQPHLVAANLDVALFHDVEQAHLDTLGQVRQLVEREDAQVGSRQEPVVDGQLVAEVSTFGDLDRVDLADEICDGDVGRGELLAVAAIARDPRDLGLVAALGHALAAGLADRREGIVIDLAAGHRGHLGVEQLDQESRHAGLGLAALAQEDDVLAGQDRVLDLRQDALLVPDDAGEERVARPEPRDQVVSQLLLDRLRLIPALT